MGTPEQAPDLVTLNDHLARPRFVAGQERGRWKLLAQEGTTLVVRITGKHYESGTAESLEFKLECDGLPEIAPYVYRWDHSTNQRPPAPPTGFSTPGVVDALKDWEGPDREHGGIYRAWQRYAADHGDWRTKRPDEAWHRRRDITFIMERLYDLASEHAAWLADRPAAAGV